MAIVLLICAACGLAMQARYGSYVDIPPELVYGFQVANAIHCGLLASALVFSGHKRSHGFPRPIKKAIKEQERHCFTLIAIGVATFAAIAFYEFFDYGVVVALASFPVLWMARLVLASFL